MHYVNNGEKTYPVYDIDEALEIVKNTYKEQQEQIERLQEKVAYYESKNMRDQEIQKYKKLAEEAMQEKENGFVIPNDIYKKMEAWKEQHIKKKHWDAVNKCQKYVGAIGGSFIYEFQPTSIGTLITCKCGCGEYISEMD